MSVFSGPEEHAANPPETWRVVKVADRNWHVVTADGSTVLHRALTKREAGYAIEMGFMRNLYDQETRWYAGERINGWKPYVECLGERPHHTLGPYENGYTKGFKDAETGRCLTPEAREGYNSTWLGGYDAGQRASLGVLA